MLSLETELRDDDLLNSYAERVAADAPGMYPAVVGAVTGRVGVPIHDARLLHCHQEVLLYREAYRIEIVGHTRCYARVLISVVRIHSSTILKTGKILLWSHQYPNPIEKPCIFHPCPID